MARGGALFVGALALGVLAIGGVAWASSAGPVEPSTDDEPENDGVPPVNATYALDGSPPGKHFSWDEVVASATAAKLGINNTPDDASKRNAIRLAREDLDPLREAIHRALEIESWFRSAELNKHIGGSSKSSAHLTGDAADVKADGLTPTDLAEIFLALNLPYDQIISYATTGHLHIGRGYGDRRMKLRYDRPGGQSRPWDVRPAVRLPDGRLQTSSGKVV